MSKTSIKMIAILLSLLILLPEISTPSDSVLSSFYHNAVTSYEKGDYEEAVFHLNTCLELAPVEKPVFKAKIFLMLASCYTKLGNEEKSKISLSFLKQLIEAANLKGIPSLYLNGPDHLVVELNPIKIAGYKTIFKDKKFKVKRLIEKVGRRKTYKKKKKLVLMITCAVLVSFVAAILIFKRKKEKPAPEEPYRDIEWVRIPAGEFEMGDDKNIGEADERPLHKVHLNEYYISKYEVTFEQYDKFCDETGRKKPSNEIYGHKFLPRGKFPVVNIMWNDAKAYCDWLSQKSGRNIHLPTEAQWEKAARGTDKRIYPWGDQSPDSNLANWNTNNNDNKPQIVGSHPDGNSPYGICDMAGNVWEYCSDWYEANYYSVTPYNNPPGPSNGLWKIVRGGSFRRSEGACRSSFRGGNYRSFYHGSIGFRPVMEM